MLTTKQRELLLLIDSRMKENGIPPSFDEMRVALQLKSKSGIHRMITALEERGFIRRLANRARALEVLKRPDQDRAASHRPGASPKRNQPPIQHAIPLLGRIAAGSPISAIQDQRGTVPIPPDMLGPGDHYALEVMGNSMVEANIVEGDTVIIKRQETANDGDIVVALIDDAEATLKRLRVKQDRIHLEAANPNYVTQIYMKDRVRIQGKLVTLVRRYH